MFLLGLLKKNNNTGRVNLFVTILVYMEAWSLKYMHRIQ